MPRQESKTRLESLLLEAKLKNGHSIKVDQDAYRVEWPFFRMKKDDFFIVQGPKAKQLRTRAMAAAYHYRESYGKWFKSEKIDDNEYWIICTHG